MRSPSRPSSSRTAAVFVDVDDLVSALGARLSGGTRPEAFVADALRALAPFIGRSFGARVVSSRAYGDFATLDGGAEMMRGLAQAYAEPVYAAPRTGEMALSMDAACLLRERPDVEVLVVVSGTRAYAPLARRARQMGRRVLVLTTETTREREDDSDVVSVFDLAPLAERQAEPRAARAPREGIEYQTVESAMGLRVLEVIEEFFGQYDEVYLTPLLRKLTDEIGADLDPKAMISDLEAAGAVYLEKRRGFPHDYTVLLVDGQHPDVVRVRDLFEDEDDGPNTAALPVAADVYDGDEDEGDDA